MVGISFILGCYIYRVMKELGATHPGLISPLLPELLSIDPHFEMPEPNMDDDCYIAVMIAVYNAAARESELVSLVPAHTARHYRFHRSRLPDLVPVVYQVSLGGGCAGGENEGATLLPVIIEGLPSVLSLDL